MRHASAFLAFALLGSLAGAPLAAAPSTPSLTDSLRLDPRVRTGVLLNGLRYFIRGNHRPEKRAELWLVVDAGSNQETDEQRGLAHFCEHMNFNGSAHFKPDEMVAYLQSVGLRFGADANASTSFDETAYTLTVPTDRDTLLDRGMTALADFAGGATLGDAEIQKERGVVMEEWRLGRGAGDRMWRQQLPALYHGSRYAERVPIGLPEIIRSAPAERLREFYRKWYTPDRMAVIVVGDFDEARMEKLVRSRFGGLAGPATTLPRTTPEIPLHTETLVAIATDKEATGSSVSLLFKHPHRATRTVMDYRAGLIEDLYGAMLNARFAEITHRANPPFLNAGGGSSKLGRTLDTWNLGAAVTDSGVARGLGALLDEAARVRRYGFLPSELERARNERRKWIESSYAEREKSESDGFANAYARVFLAGEPEIGVEATHELDGALLDGVTLDDVNALTPRLMQPEGRVLLVNAPEKAGTRVPTETELRAILDRPANPALAPWADATAGATLMASLPQPGSVVSRRAIEPLGVTVLQLSNGVEVWLKPTDFKADEVLIGGYAMGGLSLADSATFWTSALATAIVADGGVGGFTGTDLQKLLAGRIAYLSPYASSYTQGVSGQARPADLETELQLLYLYFTRPTENPDAFGALRQRLQSRLADRANSPDQVFADTVGRVNSGGYFAFAPLTRQALDRVELKPALEAYRRRFTNAADYTFFLVGAFQVDSVVPMLARYLGSLPSTGTRTAAFADRGPRFPRGVRKVVVRKGVEPKARTVITFFVNDGIEELDLHRGRACASILTECLRRSLREMLGGTYSASASFNALLPAPGYASMSISFGCDPARVDSMVAAALAEVRRLCDQGPSLDDVKKDQEIERRELEVSMKQNSYWLGSLQTSHQLQTDPLRILKRAERIDLLTPAGLKATFAKYFPMDRYTVITLLPEEGATGGKSSP